MAAQARPPRRRPSALYGELPFAGGSSAEVLAAMVRALASPVPPERKVPERPRSALVRALALRAEDRWPTLQNLAARRTAEAHALAGRAVALARQSGNSLDDVLRSEADVFTVDGRFEDAIAAYDDALAEAENAYGARHPRVAVNLGSAIPALTRAGQVVGAVAFASAHGTSPPRQLALSRALGGGDARRSALAIARPARARLDGRGYHGLKTEIDGWLATMNRLLANKRRAHGMEPSFQKSIRRISYLSSIW